LDKAVRRQHFFTRSNHGFIFLCHSFSVSKPQYCGSFSEVANLASAILCGLSLRRWTWARSVLPKGKKVLQNALEAVANSDAPEQWIYEAQTGWLKGGKAFVQVRRVIGDPGAKIIGVNQSKAVIDRSGTQSAAGKWTTWRDAVAEPARHSTTLMLAICAPLAAPLLDIARRQSFTINLFGPSSAGKSCKATTRKSIYAFATSRTTSPQGQETARASAYTAAHGGLHRTWNSIVLTSCEKSVHDMARLARLERQQGESRRLIDVPAVFNGLTHVFDRAPQDVDNVDAWKSLTFARLSDAVEQNHGKAFRKYIKSVIARRDSLKEDVTKHVDHFMGLACKNSDGEIARDVAQKFGLIYAGGVLGIECKLLPWTKCELLDAVMKSYFGARELLPDTGVLLQRGKVAFKALRNRLPFIRQKDRLLFAYQNADGFKEKVKDLHRYLIKKEVFAGSFSSNEEQDLVTKWLVEKGRITLATPKKSAGASGRKPKEQHPWPDGERRRSIEIFWPVKKKAKRKGKAK
jgi:Domain of unknown function (DUF927)